MSRWARGPGAWVPVSSTRMTEGRAPSTLRRPCCFLGPVSLDSAAGGLTWREGNTFDDADGQAWTVEGIAQLYRGRFLELTAKGVS